ncbi:MAG: hypothetical protein EOP36_15125 [Rubrivivax sp.]|nr:MAG: hypothetical protein EOP36_15125 [Rubrivivax sp.]
MPLAMDWTFEFQGSEVQWTEVSGGQVCLRFSAAAVRQGLGAALEDGHVKGLELRFTQAVLTGGDQPLCMGALSNSTLTIDGVAHRHIPVPFTASGEVRAELHFRSGTILSLSSTGVQCLPPAAPHFQVSYAC